MRLDCVQAGHAEQVTRVLPEAPSGRRLLPAVATKATSVSTCSASGFRCQRVAQVVRRPHQDAVCHQSRRRSMVQVHRHALGQQGLAPQRRGCPSVVPGWPRGAAELVEIACACPDVSNTGRGVLLAHLGHPLAAAAGLGKRIHIAVGGIHRQFRMHHPAAAAHVGQRAPQPLRHGGQVQPLGAELLAEHWQQAGRATATAPAPRAPTRQPCRCAPVCARAGSGRSGH